MARRHGYFIPAELKPKVKLWQAAGQTKEEAEATVIGLYLREEGPYGDHAGVEGPVVERWASQSWRALCGHCGRLAHAGTCLAGEGSLDVGTPTHAPTLAPAVDERDEPASNSPADVLGPLHGRAA